MTRSLTTLLRVRGRLFLASAAAIALLVPLIAGCGNNPAAPETASLAGVVTDSTGQPLAGVRISVVFADPFDPIELADRTVRLGASAIPSPVVLRAFSVRGNPSSTGYMTFMMAIPSPGTQTLQITRRSGAVVRTLLDKMPFVAGMHNLAWDGTDDRGMHLANGLYIAKWRDDEGDSVFNFRAPVLINIRDPERCNNAVTGSDGSFKIARGDLPLGSVIQASDPNGENVTDFTIPPVVDVLVSGLVRGTVHGAVVSGVQLSEMKRDVVVNIKL